MLHVAVHQRIVERLPEGRLLRRSHINDVLVRARRTFETLSTPVRQSSRRDYRRLRRLPMFKHASPIRSTLATCDTPKPSPTSTLLDDLGEMCRLSRC